MTAKRNTLVALGSAAVVAVYSAGYLRTRSAAEAATREPAEIRPAMPPRTNLTPAPTTTTAPVETPKPTVKAPRHERKAERVAHADATPSSKARTDSGPMVAMA